VPALLRRLNDKHGELTARIRDSANAGEAYATELRPENSRNRANQVLIPAKSPRQFEQFQQPHPTNVANRRTMLRQPRDFLRGLALHVRLPVFC
jgi:hypothetical protein